MPGYHRAQRAVSACPSCRFHIQLRIRKQCVDQLRVKNQIRRTDLAQNIIVTSRGAQNIVAPPAIARPQPHSASDERALHKWRETILARDTALEISLLAWVTESHCSLERIATVGAR
jgi:hypothetical protein